MPPNERARRKLLLRCLAELAIGMAAALALFLWEYLKHRASGAPGERLFSLSGLVLMGAIILVAAVLLAARDYAGGLKKIRLMENAERHAGLPPLAAACVGAYPGVLRDRTAEVDPCAGNELRVQTFLEERTLNWHRAILFLEIAPAATSEDAGHRWKSAVLEWVSRHLRPSWWRGLGVGLVMIDCRPDPLSSEALAELVDWSGLRTSVFQWLIYVSEAERRVVGVHMRQVGRSSTCFMALAKHLGAEDYKADFSFRDASDLAEAVLRRFRRTDPQL